MPMSAFPDPAKAPKSEPLAFGGDLSVGTLLDAYRHGIFPWFSDGQPVLWWTTDPRMVLSVSDFKLTRSLRKTIQRFRRTPGCEIRVDSAIAEVLDACAREGVTAPLIARNACWNVRSVVERIVHADAGFGEGVIEQAEGLQGDRGLTGTRCVERAPCLAHEHQPVIKGLGALLAQ